MSAVAKDLAVTPPSPARILAEKLMLDGKVTINRKKASVFESLANAVVGPGSFEMQDDQNGKYLEIHVPLVKAEKDDLGVQVANELARLLKEKKVPNVIEERHATKDLYIGFAVGVTEYERLKKELGIAR